MGNRKTFAVLIFAILFLLYGCTESINGLTSDKDEFINKNVTKFMDVANNSNPSNCFCMICENSTTTSWFGTKEFGTFKNGSCYFYPNCNFTTLGNLEKQGNATLKTFMVGTGTTFTDFNMANAFCKNGQDMPVKWIWTRGNDYPIPKGERAGCMLNNNVVPMYVLYSNGKAANQIDTVKKIASQFNGQGPVIVTTEINYNESDADAIAKQAIALKTNCPNCMVALAPKLNDAAGLDKVMELLKGKPKTVDLIAFGVDSRYYNYPSCDPEWLLYVARNFSQYAMVKYQTPSVWPYMFVDEGSNNTNSIQNCTWSANSNAVLNSDFFKTEMPNAISNGVIGAARYAFTDAVNPLNVSSGSEVLLNYSNNNWVSAIEPRYSHWYSFCSVYSSSYASSITVSGKKLDFSYTNRMTNIFPNQTYLTQGCPFGLQNVKFYEQFKDGSSYYENTKPENIAAIPPDDMNNLNKPADPYYKCDYCVRSQEEIPFPSMASSTFSNSALCNGFPEIDIYADRWDVDPLLAKANAYIESGAGTTDPQHTYCVASYPVDINVGACNYPQKLQVVEDPSHVCPTVDYTNKKGMKDAGFGKLVSTNTPGKPCAFGLMQVIEMPYTYWQNGNTGGGMSAESVSRVCFSDFNPFNATHNACLGTYKMYSGGVTARGVVEKLSADPELHIKDENTKKWWEAYLLLGYYGGHNFASSVSAYKTAKKPEDIGGECTVKKTVQHDDGTTSEEEQKVQFLDFPHYIKLCEGSPYAYAKLYDYAGLTKTCAKSDCPYGKLSKNAKP